MDPVLMKLLAVAAITLLVGKRAIIGPQVQFARASVAMVAAGIGVLQLASQKGDFYATVGAVLMLGGLLLAVAMVTVDCVHTIRSHLYKQTP